MIIGGNHTQALSAALRGIDAQREAHEHNIANVETPDFLAKRVTFADSLNRAIQRQNPGDMEISTYRSLDATRPDGNNVRLDHEVVALERNALHQQLMTQALNHAYGRLRAAIGR